MPHPGHSRGIMPDRSPKTRPMDGLELTPEVIHSTTAAIRQCSRREIGLKLADHLLGGELQFVDLEDGPAVVNCETGELVEGREAAFAALLAFAGDPSNHAAGIFDDGAGGTYHGGTSFWRSSLRLDPNWIEAMRRRSREKARTAMRKMMDGLSTAERCARRYGWRQKLTLKLLTLTMPHHAGTDTIGELKRLNHALTLLKKRAFWCTAVVGGIKGVEDALTAKGPHVHAHMLILSRYLDRARLVEEWRECLDAATWEAYGHGLSEDCPVIVDIRAVRKKGGKGDDSISWEDALNETTKYMTKPSNFLQGEDGEKIPREALLALCEVKRWPRMFELLGRCREAYKQATPQEMATAATAALDSIRRAYLTGEPSEVPRSVTWEWVEGWDHETDGSEEMRIFVVNSLKLRESGALSRGRPPSWRDLLDTLSLSEWLAMMAGRFRRGRMFRLNQILRNNPSAYLVTFNGLEFGCAPEY